MHDKRNREHERRESFLVGENLDAVRAVEADDVVAGLDVGDALADGDDLALGGGDARRARHGAASHARRAR